MTKFMQTARKAKRGPFRRVGLYNGKAYWTGTPMGILLRRRGMVITFTKGTAADRQIAAALTRQGMQGRRKTIAVDKRALGKAWMVRALAHKAQYHYLQRRKMELAKLIKLKGHVYADCSETTTAIAKVMGAPDPNGNKYDGTGYTGTLRRATQVRLSQLKVGDFIVHGRGTGVHVVTVFEPHPTNPLCFSHGQESGPTLYRHSVQVAAHGGYFTCHSVGV